MAEQATSLSVGSRGEAVKELQQWLNHAFNAGLIEDGKYGRKTSQAVSNFQRESGIEQDGIAGVNTIESIISYEGEDNEEEENEETIQGAEEEVTPTAQEEPEEEEVTPEEEAEFEEPVQAPAAPEQDTTPEVTPEEEAEFAAPEGEDPALSQQPQTTTALQTPTVPQGDDTSNGMDPAIQQTVAAPKPRPVPTWNDTDDGSDGRTGVPAEIPQATKKIQQQTAGNYQKFHKPRQPSTNPATNTITPADFNHGMSPQAKKSEPQAQASTDPATNTIAPKEVPVQPYQSRDMFRQDLNTAFVAFNKMVTANNHEGMDQLQAQIQNIQQRIQGQEQQYPKLSNYLNQLNKNVAKWATYAESEIKFRPILTEADSKSVEAEIKQAFANPENYIPKVSEIESLIQTTTKEPYDFSSKAPPDSGNIAIKWTGPSIKFLTVHHEDAIMASSQLKNWRHMMQHADRDTVIKNLEAKTKSNNGKIRNKAIRELERFYEIEQWADKYLDSKGKLAIDEDMYEDLYDDADIPFIIEKGKVYLYNNLRDLFQKYIIPYTEQSRKFSWDGIGTDLIDHWEDAIGDWEDIDSQIGNLTQEWENLGDEEKRNRYNQLRSKAGLGVDQEEVDTEIDLDPFGLAKKIGLDLDTTFSVGLDKKEQEQIIQSKLDLGVITPAEAEELRGLTDWYNNEFQAKLDKEEAEEEEREAKSAENKKNRAANDHTLNQELLADLTKDVQNPTQDDSFIAQEEDKETILAQAQDHATRAVEFLTTTIEGIGWSEDNAPLDTDPKSKIYAGIGEKITDFYAKINNYKESASTEDFAVLEKDFDEIVTLVDDYSTTT